MASSSDSQSGSDAERDLIIHTDSENDLLEDTENKSKKRKRQVDSEWYISDPKKTDTH